MRPPGKPARSSAVSIICIVLFGALHGTPLAAQTTRDARWRQDLNYLAAELPQRHVNLFFQLPRAMYEGPGPCQALFAPFLLAL